MSLVVIAVGASYTWRLVNALSDYGGGLHMTTQRMLISFVALSGTIVLLQLLTLRYSAALLWPSDRGRRGSHGHESLALFVHEDVIELLDVDLSRSPPEAELSLDGTTTTRRLADDGGAADEFVRIGGQPANPSQTDSDRDVIFKIT